MRLRQREAAEAQSLVQAWTEVHARGRRSGKARSRVKQPSKAPPYPDPVPKLVVLDLNGTLVYRRKNAQGRTVSTSTAKPRPYLQCFLRYCLGPLYTMERDELDAAWPPSERTLVHRSAAPYGAHFWLPAAEPGSLYEPPLTPIALMIWSSATEANVDKMMHQFPTNDLQRALFQRVWARASLVQARDMLHKVDTVKDLSIVWDDVNAWKAHAQGKAEVERRPRARARADATQRLMAYRANHRNQARPSGRGPGELHAEATARIAEQGRTSTYGALPTTPWGPHNTLLLDDSRDKARCQPYNHLCIPEYTAGTPTDDYLLQCIGVLDTLQSTPDVSAWIREHHRGLLSPDQPADVRAAWCQKGREALARQQIPVTP